MTWSTWFDRWLADVIPGLEADDQFSYATIIERSVRLHLRPRIGAKLMSETTAKDITRLWKALYSEADGAKSHKTVKNIRGVLSLANKDAIAEGLMVLNVVALSKTPKKRMDPEADEDLGAMTILTPEGAEWTIARCLAGDFGRWSLPALLALETGLRRGEVLGIWWSEINFDTRVLRVRRQVLEHSGEKGRRLGRLKTDASYRDLVLPRRTFEALQARRDAVGGSGKTLVFLDDAGQMMSPDAWTQAWGRQIAPKHLHISGTTPHDLRHTNASLSLRFGEPLASVSKRLGHKNASFTMDRYVSPIPGDSEAAASQWSKALDRLQVGDV
jgi:integrase